MEQVLQLVVVFFAALATGGLMVNWIGLGRAMSRLSVSTYVEFYVTPCAISFCYATDGSRRKFRVIVGNLKL